MDPAFKTVDWAAAANIYEVNVRQYTTEGTLTAFEKSLPRLREMGIDILWFMPLTPISVLQRQGTLGSYYACSSYTEINPEFGTKEDFKKVVQSAHTLGFKVIIDWVANHTGYDHHWTVERPDFYKKNDKGHFYEAHGWVDVIDLNYDNGDLRNAMLEAMRFWITEYHIDGFRCDMAHLVPLDFWRQARKALDEKNNLFWLAESEVAEYHEVFDATYAWELLHTMEAVYKGAANLQHLIDLLAKFDWAFPADALRLSFTSNHDENTHSGSEFERFGDSAEAFAVLCTTWKNTLPLVYSGQEMPNKKRLKFFEKDAIEWTDQYFYADFYKTLLSFRKNSPIFQRNNESTTALLSTTAPDNVFSFLRKYHEEELLVFLNLSALSNLNFTITDPLVNGNFTNVFSGDTTEVKSGTALEMHEWDYLVYRKVSQ